MRRDSYTVPELTRLERFAGLTEKKLLAWIREGWIIGKEEPSRFWRVPITELPAIQALYLGASPERARDAVRKAREPVKRDPIEDATGGSRR